MSMKNRCHARPLLRDPNLRYSDKVKDLLSRLKAQRSYGLETGFKPDHYLWIHVMFCRTLFRLPFSIQPIFLCTSHAVTFFLGLSAVMLVSGTCLMMKLIIVISTTLCGPIIIDLNTVALICLRRHVLTSIFNIFFRGRWRGSLPDSQRTTDTFS